MKKCKIALSDESPFIMRSVRHYLACFASQTEIFSFPMETEKIIEELIANPVDILITEISSTCSDISSDGTEKIKEITQKLPNLSLIILTSQRNTALLQGILKYPVAGIISKFDEGEELTNALTHLFANGGEPYISSSVQALFAEAKKAGEKGRLTLSEVEVIRKIAQGYSLSEIAKLRKRSVSTIATQKYNAMRKLLLHSTTDLIKYAFSEKLI